MPACLTRRLPQRPQPMPAMWRVLPLMQPLTPPPRLMLRARPVCSPE